MICGCDKARVMAELKFKAGLSLTRAERVKWPVWWDRVAKLICVLKDCSQKLACCSQGQKKNGWRRKACSWDRAAELICVVKDCNEELAYCSQGQRKNGWCRKACIAGTEPQSLFFMFERDDLWL